MALGLKGTSARSFARSKDPGPTKENSYLSQKMRKGRDCCVGPSTKNIMIFCQMACLSRFARKEAQFTVFATFKKFHCLPDGNLKIR